MERAVVDVEEVGNTSAASIPSPSTERGERAVSARRLVLLTSFGAGLAWGPTSSGGRGRRRDEGRRGNGRIARDRSGVRRGTGRRRMGGRDRLPLEHTDAKERWTRSCEPEGPVRSCGSTPWTSIGEGRLRRGDQTLGPVTGLVNTPVLPGWPDAEVPDGRVRPDHGHERARGVPVRSSGAPQHAARSVGRIVNVSSAVALRANAGQTRYAASKTRSSASRSRSPGSRFQGDHRQRGLSRARRHRHDVAPDGRRASDLPRADAARAHRHLQEVANVVRFLMSEEAPT